MLFNPISKLYREIPYKMGHVKVPPPKTIYLVINSVCNLHCKMCDIGQRQKDTQFYKNMDTGSSLTTKTVEKLVDEVRKYDPLIAIISTEPLLHPRLFEIIDIIRKSGLQVQLTTNGLLLPEYAKKLVDSDIDYLYVSIDGPRDIHNEIRGNENAWDNAVNGMRNVVYYREEAKKKYPKVRVNYTISGYNYAYLVDFLRAYHKPDDEDYPFEVSRYYSHIDFCHMNMVTDNMAELHNSKYPDLPATVTSTSDAKSTNVDANILWNQIQEIKATYSKKFVSFVPEMDRKQLVQYYMFPASFIENRTLCKVPWHSAQILANGDLGIATRCFNVKLGNINESKFMDIWNGKEMQQFRKNLKRVGAYPACSRCCGVF